MIPPLSDEPASCGCVESPRPEPPFASTRNSLYRRPVRFANFGGERVRLCFFEARSGIGSRASRWASAATPRGVVGHSHHLLEVNSRDFGQGW